MYGVILGDLIGFPYEYEHVDLTDKSLPLFRFADEEDAADSTSGKRLQGRGAGSGYFSGNPSGNSPDAVTQPQAGRTFSDKTVLTAAMEDGLIRFEKKLKDILGGEQRAGRNLFEETYLEELTSALRRFGQAHPLAGYPMELSIWLFREGAAASGTEDPGAALRAVPAAWMFQEDLYMMRHLAVKQAQLTHRGEESVKAAEALASAVFLSIHGCTKEYIAAYLEREFGYVFPDEKGMREEILRAGQNVGPQLCVRAALTAFLHGRDFEDAVRRAVSYGGRRADTAAAAAAVAEAYFGIPEDLLREGKRRLPDDIGKAAEAFAARIAEKKKIREQNPAAMARWKSAMTRATAQHPAAVQGNEPLEQAIARMSEKRDQQSFVNVLEMLRLRKNQNARVFVPVISVKRGENIIPDSRTGPAAADDPVKTSPAAGTGAPAVPQGALACRMQAIRTRDGRLWQPAYTSRVELDRANAILASMEGAEPASGSMVLSYSLDALLRRFLPPESAGASNKEPSGPEASGPEASEPEQNSKSSALVSEQFPPQIQGLVLNPGGKAFFLPRKTIETVFVFDLNR